MSDKFHTLLLVLLVCFYYILTEIKNAVYIKAAQELRYNACKQSARSSRHSRIHTEIPLNIKTYINKISSHTPLSLTLPL